MLEEEEEVEEEEEDDEEDEEEDEDDERDAPATASHLKKRSVELRKGYLLMKDEELWKILKLDRVGAKGLTITRAHDESSSMLITEADAIDMRKAYLSWQKAQKGSRSGSTTSKRQKKTPKAKAPLPDAIETSRELIILLAHPKLPTGMLKTNEIPDAPWIRTSIDVTALLDKYGKNGAGVEAHDWGTIGSMTKKEEKTFKESIASDLLSVLRPKECSVRVLEQNNCLGYEYKPPGNAKPKYYTHASRSFFQNFFVDAKSALVLVVEVDGPKGQEAAEQETPEDGPMLESIKLPRLADDLQYLVGRAERHAANAFGSGAGGAFGGDGVDGSTDDKSEQQLLRDLEAALIKESHEYKLARAKAIRCLDNEVADPRARDVLHKCNSALLGPPDARLPMHLEAFSRLLKSRIRHEDRWFKIWQLWSEGQRPYSSAATTPSWAQQMRNPTSGDVDWGRSGHTPGEERPHARQRTGNSGHTPGAAAVSHRVR